MKKLLGFACLVAVVVTTSLSGASTATRTKPTAVPADAVLTWNTNAVDAVRGSSPAKSQIDAVFLMAYAQAAVYGAVTKLEGRYVPYHDVATAVAPDGSVQAAVAAAASTILDHYLPDQQPTVDAEYAAYLATLTGNVAGGVAVGEAAANDLIALRTGDGRNAATPVYGTIGPVLPGSGSSRHRRRLPRLRGRRRCARSCSSGRRSSAPTRRRPSTASSTPRTSTR
jgi:hypothetical protein